MPWDEDQDGPFLVCPRGHRGPFRYLEDIVCWRTVVRLVRSTEKHEHSVTDPGELAMEIEGLYKTGEGYDDGENWRLECRYSGPGVPFCGAEFPIPNGISLEFDP